MVNNSVSVDEEALKNVGRQPGEPKVVPSRTIALGRVIQELDGMTNADALWTLRRAIRILGGK